MFRILIILMFDVLHTGRKEGNGLFNDALNTFYFRLSGMEHMVKDHSAREETCWCNFMGHFFQLAARVHLYTSRFPLLLSEWVFTICPMQHN